jgi:hypothetical protein
MRKIELQELVLDYLSGGDAPSDVRGKYHSEIINNHVNLAYNGVVFKIYMEGKSYSDYSMLDAWARNYTITITDIDEPKGNVLLPYPPVQLPNNMGILQLTPSDDLVNAFAYRETNANAVFAALEVAAVSTRPTFYMEQNTGSGVNTHVLKLDKIPSGCTEVFLKLIVPLEQVDDYDTIAIPAGNEEKIIGFVIDLLRGKRDQDTVNDGIANQK